MSMLAQGKIADSEGKFVIAMGFYEKAVEEENPNGEAIAYLMALCWQMTEYGFNCAHQLSSASIQQATLVLDGYLDAASRHASRPEVAFWRAYIGWADLGWELAVEECEGYLALRPNFPDPLVYIAQSVEDKPGAAAARQLIDRFAHEKTARGMYLSSVAEAVLA